jgi:predicted amidohydrolase YtcJ
MPGAFGAQHSAHQGNGRRSRSRTVAFAGEYFAERYCPEAAAHAPPSRQMLDAGLIVDAGTDATVASYNPWISLYWMVTGSTVGGMLLASPEDLLSRQEALRLYTV